MISFSSPNPTNSTMRSPFRNSFLVQACAVLLMQQATVDAAMDVAELANLCTSLFGETYGSPNNEPLGPCQWWLSLVGATIDGSGEKATGKGVKIGIIDSGLDFDHPDIAPNVDVETSCSFIFDSHPEELRLPEDVGNGDCSNKIAARDYGSHGTHVGAIVAAPVNGVGIAGVAPEATLVSIKACAAGGYCFADSVAAALRYAGDVGMDIVNLSLFADPYLYYCKNDKAQKEILDLVAEAVRYAQQKGVLIVAAAGNESNDLQHPKTDDISPDYPDPFPSPDKLRNITNACVVAPAELPGVLTVSSLAAIGIEESPANTQMIADYATVGMSRVDVTAPGGDYFKATGTVQDGIISAMSSTDNSDLGTWSFFDSLETDVPFPGLTATDENDDRYGFLNGSSMASPVAAGVAALLKQVSPGITQGALKALVQQTATKLECPAEWEPEGEDDDRERCYGKKGRTSFFGHGLVNANVGLPAEKTCVDIENKKRCEKEEGCAWDVNECAEKSDIEKRDIEEEACDCTCPGVSQAKVLTAKADPVKIKSAGSAKETASILVVIFALALSFTSW